MKTGHYHRAIGDLKKRLASAIPHDVLKELHRKTPARHFAVAVRQALLFAAAFAAAWVFPSLWVRVPAAIVLGFIVFDGTVLLHEVVHKTVFDGDRPRAYRVLGLLYALPSGISPSQFTRWHLDHHLELGSTTDDPKRAHLSPKINARWLKLLYWTPALFPIYFRAAAKETATYPDELKSRIARERAAAILLHLGVASAILVLGGPARLLWLWAVPVFFVFPPAFALNRLGQHYDIEPEQPARWATRMARSRFWEFVYLWSSYHLEHHYFPAVAFYELPRLNAELTPFFEAEGIPERTYGQLVWGWLVENQRPHSSWETRARSRESSAA
ncbi:MAG TPA: fatty acid desaturase [Thermoanaerobaculia bacterium]|nr:fatty acid desaturase [Thermoanaerobaculia bacterium]